jgi:hypothetical protein
VNALKYGTLILLTLCIGLVLLLMSRFIEFLLSVPEEETPIGRGLFFVWIIQLVVCELSLIALAWWWAGKGKMNRSLLTLAISIIIQVGMVILFAQFQ